MELRAYVGQVVHYVSYGTPGGEYRSACRAAILSEVSGEVRDVVGLVVLNPTGIFFRSLADGGCDYRSGNFASGGSWHTLEDCGSVPSGVIS